MKGILVLALVTVLLLSGCTSPVEYAEEIMEKNYTSNVSQTGKGILNESASILEIEFLSLEEWTRKTNTGTLTRRIKTSEDSIGPVKLSLSTLEQPLRAGDGFFIGIELKSIEEGKEIALPVRVEVNIPDEFGNPGCPQKVEGRVGKIIWEIAEDDGFEEKITYCDFYPEAEEIVPAGIPLRTYLITATAE